MRPIPLFAVLALAAACAADDAPPADDTDPVVADTDPGGPTAGVAPQCSETYSIPGPQGLPLDKAVDPHQDVFGGPEPVGEVGTVGPDPKHVHLGWPSSDPSRSVSFVWSTDTGTLSSVVEIAQGTDLAGEVTRYEGVSFLYGDGAYRVHELKLCGRLEPDTTYSYRVGGEGHWSEVFTFTTPGEPGSFDTFVLAFAGDSRGSYEQWGTLVSRMVADDPDAVLFSGDMVEFGTSQEEWYAWWEATGTTFAERFFVPAHGNHEYLATNYFAQFSLPNNEQWFSLDYGDMSLAVLIDFFVPLAAMEVDQVAFMEEVLGQTDAAWKLAMHHATTYSICDGPGSADGHGSAEHLRGMWEPTFEATGVDLVVAGHNHIYERSLPLRGGEVVAPEEGTTYIVTGGAGAPLYRGVLTDEADTWFNAVAEPVEHFVLAEFGPDGVQLTAKDLAGNVIDSFFLPRH